MSIQWFDRETLDRVIVNHIQKIDVVLDIGCGIRPQTFFEPELHLCCEPYPEYVRILQNRFVRHPRVMVLQGTWEQALSLLPDRAVDSVFILDVIEHLEKDEGRLLLRASERVARKQIVVFTPLGFMPQECAPTGQDGWGLGGTGWQAHRSGWTPEDFDVSWDILGAKAYHTHNGQGEPLDPPFGAFWALKNIQPQGERAPVRFALVSDVLPPAPSERAILLCRLLHGLGADEYALISTQDYGAYTYLQNSTMRLPGRYYHIATKGRQPPQRRSALSRLVGIIDMVGQIIRRARGIVRIIRRERSRVLVAAWGASSDLAASYLASRWVRVPLCVYALDGHTPQRPGPAQRLFAHAILSLILRGAARVIVSNEAQAQTYHARYGIEPLIISPSEEAAGQVDSTQARFREMLQDIGARQHDQT